MVIKLIYPGFLIFCILISLKQSKKSPTLNIKSLMLIFAFYGGIWFLLTLITLIQTPIPEPNNYEIQQSHLSQSNIDEFSHHPVEKLKSECRYDPQENWEIPVLMYHHIQDNVDTSNPSAMLHTVSPANFGTQLDTITRQGYTPVTFYNVAANCLPEKPVIITLDDGYTDAFTQAFPALKARNMVATFYIPTGLIGTPAYMDWSQVDELAAANMELGAHSLTHTNLKTASPELQRTEILGSVADLKTNTGLDVVSFSYPFGEHDSPALQPLLSESGVKYAVIISRTNARNDQNHLLIPRYLVDDDTVIEQILR